tara:strand:+ start:988 stop:1329 length:342 start_codon:yes stop_codon:yes gene_type:complete
MGIKILSLSKNEDFKKILTGRKINNYYSTIFYKTVSSKQDDVLNLSIITKRKLGNAVQRNKIKRRLKNIVNNILKSIKINLKYSYLIIAKKNVLDSKYSNIKETILVDFKKIL